MQGTSILPMANALSEIFTCYWVCPCSRLWCSGYHDASCNLTGVWV